MPLRGATQRPTKVAAGRKEPATQPPLLPPPPEPLDPRGAPFGSRGRSETGSRAAPFGSRGASTTGSRGTPSPSLPAQATSVADSKTMTLVRRPIAFIRSLPGFGMTLSLKHSGSREA